MAGLLDTRGEALTARLSDLLAEAQLNHPSGARRPQPPCRVKKAAVWSVQFSPAQDHAVRLPLWASAGRRENDVPVHQGGSPVSETLLNVTDYARHEPEAALRAKSWKGLIKASARRHDRMIREAQLRTAGNTLSKRPETVSDAAWSAPLTGAELPGGYQAALLRSPRDLLAETNLLNHCLGLSDEYAQRCREVAPPGPAGQPPQHHHP